ncbi:MAG TPA: TrkA family potassium uptake protein [Candidatus Binatia bacterium]|jgi:trk system potassium uptake protein TrkA|nr:TrkA family potassium uptake protein [Candidatus Binatia bacterium]
MKFIIIGCGRVGVGLARTLSQRGHAVTVVDKDPLAVTGIGAAFTGQTLIGSGFDREVLLQAGIERTDGLAAVTGSDEANAVIARLARQVFRVPRVIARLYDPRKAEVYRRLGLQTINPVTWGIHRIAELLCYAQLEPIVSLGSGDVDLVETEIPLLLVGRTVNEVTIPGEVQITAISRGGKTFLPTLGTTFQEGDLLHIAVLATSANRLAALLT